jgi:protein polybromo-1
VLTILREVTDPDDDPEDEDEPPRLLIEPFEKVPTPRELPDYYEVIRCPVDTRGVERMLRRTADRSYASPWFFACAVELMLTNAQVYNDEDSQLHEEAVMLRRAFTAAMRKQFPGQPLPPPFSVYQSCDEPAWVRPAGWAAPGPEEIADEPDPFKPMEWQAVQAEEDEERAVARAIRAGGATYGGDDSGGGGRNAHGGGVRGERGGRGMFGRGPGRPRKSDDFDDDDHDSRYDPKKGGSMRSRRGGSGHRGGPGSCRGGSGRVGGGRKRGRASFAGSPLGPAAAAAKAALVAAGGGNAALTLDALVAAAQQAKAPELAGARRPGSTVLSVLRQHPDVFVESLSGAGVRFTLNKRLAGRDDDFQSGPARTSSRAKSYKRYVDPNDDDAEEEEDDDDDEADDDGEGGGDGGAVKGDLPWKARDVLKRKRSHRGGVGAAGSKPKVKFRRGGGVGGGRRYHDDEFYDDSLDDEEEAEEEEELVYDGLSPVQSEACKTMLANARELKDGEGRVVGDLFERLPTRKQLPEYYKQIAHPVDFESISRCLNNKKQGGYTSVWKFLLAVELMLSNAQVYNEVHSGLWKDAATLRAAFIDELHTAFPAHPYPEPFSVYEEEQCREPEWEAPAKAVVAAGGKRAGGKKGGGDGAGGGGGDGGGGGGGKKAALFKATFKMTAANTDNAGDKEQAGNSGASGLRVQMKHGGDKGKGKGAERSDKADRVDRAGRAEKPPPPKATDKAEKRPPLKIKYSVKAEPPPASTIKPTSELADPPKEKSEKLDKPEKPAKPMPDLAECGECSNCGGRGRRGRRCLDVQMREVNQNTYSNS